MQRGSYGSFDTAHGPVNAAMAYWLIHRARSADRAAPFATFNVARLTTTGRASFAAVSPDGKYAVHVMGSAGQPSLWLRHIPTGRDKEILPAVQGMLSGLTFSKDGSYIYYDHLGHALPLDGSAARPVTDFKSDLIFYYDWSRDGKRLAYARGLVTDDAVLTTNLR